ncbi:hypothetical protein [Flavobacterium sp. 25HG05S-40]|uniref:hypothetical protein n=1 Tax=Flavobacterium sp. 25HG05S-40 TaxID=3458682 RepID=UPI00404494D9
MNSWDLRQFRNDLSIFIKLIDDHQVTGDFTELRNLVSLIDSKSLIEYKLENVCFHINERVAGTKPDEVHFCQIFLDVMLMVKDPLVENYDPLHGYYLDINLHGYKNKTDTKKVYHSSWHLDRHLNKPKAKYTHPSYHFQYGGKKMELLDDTMLLLSSPRIPHPPMDLFLGVHFILSNFYNNQSCAFVDSLLADNDYRQIIMRAQDRLWNPYFKAFDTTNTHNDFTIANVFPLYIN